MRLLIKTTVFTFSALFASISFADQIDTYSCTVKVPNPDYKSWIPSNFVFNKRGNNVTVIYPKDINYTKIRGYTHSSRLFYIDVETVAKLRSNGRILKTKSKIEILDRSTLSLNFSVPDLSMFTTVYGRCKVKTTHINTQTTQSCGTSPAICTSEELCKQATYYSGIGFLWSLLSENKEHVKEAKKRGLSCGVGNKTYKKPKTTTKTIKPAPKKPQTPTVQKESTQEDLKNKYGEFKTYGPFIWFKQAPTALFLLNDIKINDVSYLRRAIMKHNTIDTIVLDSPGGSVGGGLQMAAVINDNKLHTYIPNNAVCASACSYMFFGGLPRYAQGKLGVHQVYTTESSSKKSTSQVEAQTQFTASEIMIYLNNFDTPPFVYVEMFASPEMYYFSEEELLQINTTSSTEPLKVIDKFLNKFDH